MTWTTQPLAAHAAVFDREVGAGNGKDGGHVAFRSGLLGFIVMFIGVAFGVLGKMVLHVDVITAIGVLVALAGMVLLAYPYLSPQGRQTREIVPVSRRESLIAAEPTKKLSPVNDADFIPSVTESTTDLLKEPVARNSN